MGFINSNAFVSYLKLCSAWYQSNSSVGAAAPSTLVPETLSTLPCASNSCALVNRLDHRPVLLSSRLLLSPPRPAVGLPQALQWLFAFQGWQCVGSYPIDAAAQAMSPGEGLQVHEHPMEMIWLLSIFVRQARCIADRSIAGLIGVRHLAPHCGARGSADSMSVLEYNLSGLIGCVDAESICRLH